jgi:hypothetical protein
MSNAKTVQVSLDLPQSVFSALRQDPASFVGEMRLARRWRVSGPAVDIIPYLTSAWHRSRPVQVSKRACGLRGRIDSRFQCRRRWTHSTGERMAHLR